MASEYEAVATVRIICTAEDDQEAIDRMYEILNGCVFNVESLDLV